MCAKSFEYISYVLNLLVFICWYLQLWFRTVSCLSYSSANSRTQMIICTSNILSKAVLLLTCSDMINRIYQNVSSFTSETLIYRLPLRYTDLWKQIRKHTANRAALYIILCFHYVKFNLVLKNREIFLCTPIY